MMATLGDCMLTAELAAEQTGQKCVAEADVDTSVQKWNCATRNITPRSNAKRRTRSALLCILISIDMECRAVKRPMTLWLLISTKTSSFYLRC